MVRLNNKKKIMAGFTVVELMVSIGILAMINTIIFFNYPELRERVNLKKASEEIALVLRQAQSDAITVKKFKESFPWYGVHFDNNSGSLVFFADMNPENLIYNGNCVSDKVECVKEYKINNGIKIKELFFSQNGSPYSRSNVCNDLNIVFSRPSPLASIKATGVGCPSFTPSSALIELSFEDSSIKKYLEVWVNGQISVKEAKDVTIN